MKDILTRLSAPLTKEDVELRVGSNSAKSFTLLLYKTARTDMKRLNDVCPTWGNSHRLDENSNVKCAITIYDEMSKAWVSREDVGTESNTEKEKGSYSDSFKRAGTRWGIGLELYNTDQIRIMWEMEVDDSATKRANGKNKYKPKNFWANELELTKYEVANDKPRVEIGYKGNVVFTNFKSGIPREPASPMKITPHEADGYLMSALDNVSAIKTIQELDDYLANKAPAQDKYFRSAKINRSDLAEQLTKALDTKGRELR